MLPYFSWIDQAAGFAWVWLSVIMVSLLIRIGQTKGLRNSLFMMGLFLLTVVWLYPFYTGLYTWLITGFFGNIATLILTVMFSKRLRNLSQETPRWMVPQMVWLSLATVHLALLIVVQYG